jgi:hypothetical protein
MGEGLVSQIESMLLQWRSLYAEWVVAELELRAARHRRPGSRAVAMLEARVRELQQACQAALDHTSAALASAPESGVEMTEPEMAGPEMARSIAAGYHATAA